MGTIRSIAIAATVAVAAAEEAKTGAVFFETYCLECHQGEDPEGGFDLAPLLEGQGNFTDHAPEWLDALDLVEDESMPPPKKRGEIPMPSATERERAMKWARHFLAEASGTAGRPPRRLNRTMYNHTIRDLLGVEASPADRFPQDLGLHGFNNSVETQTVSPFLLERYLDAAREMLELATVEVDKPEPIHHFHYPLSRKLKGGGKLVPADVDLSEVRKLRPHQLKPEQVDRLLNLDWGSGDDKRNRIGDGPHGYEVLLHHTGTLQHRGKIPLSAPYEGARYRLTVHARAEKATDREGKEVEPAGAALLGFEVNGRLEELVEIPLGGPVQAYTAELVTHREKSEFSFVAASPLAKPAAGRVPPIVVTHAEIEGPLYDEWPPESHQRLFGESGETPDEKTLRMFISRAFRRPATEEEMAKYQAIARAEVEAGSSEREALRVALQAVLVSPNFLFLIEERRPDGALSDYELASRLSYFLWSSMPDEELFGLAAQRKLSDPEVLREQVGRMLRDEKAEAFVQSFGGQWLGFHRIAELAPDPKQFPDWDEELRAAMLGEMEHLFRHIMREDRPIAEFLDADYTFANNRLRRHYGWPQQPDSTGFERVELEADDPRGGLVTQAGVLTVASQPTRSSPVFRGIYVVERLFNRPPPNPPAQVPELEESAGEGGEAKTVKEQLAAHVADPNCASCHQKIDPWGLPLEAFNGIGQWREQSREQLGTTLPDGEAIAGPDELKRALLGRHESFVRGLSEKMLMYSLGRSLGWAEDQEIDAIMARSAEGDHRFHSLVEAIVLSDSFRSF